MAEYRDRIRVHIDGKEYSVVGGGFQEMLATVKQISGRRFVSELKIWQLPGSFEDIQNQLDIGGYRLEGGKSISTEDAAVPAASASPADTANLGTDRIRILVQGHEMSVVGGSFQEMLTVVKGLPKRRFNPESKHWEVPGEPSIIKTLIETAGFQLEGADQLPAGPAPTAESTEFTPPEFGPLTPPQEFEAPDFSGEAEILPYEPPHWWDDDGLPPPMAPPDWWDEDEAAPPPETSVYPTETPDLENQPINRKNSSASHGSDQIRVRLGGIPMVITGGSFQAILTFVKSLPGRRFDGQDKVWDIPEELTLDGLRQRGEAAGFVVKRD